MSAEGNEALLRRYVSEIWDNARTQAIDEFLSPSYCRHVSELGPPLNREQQKRLLQSFRAAFPDIRLTLHDVVATENWIAFRSTIHGTHEGEFLGLPSTDKKVTVGLVDMIRIEDGKFVEQWGGPNLLDLAQQLGAKLSPG